MREENYEKRLYLARYLNLELSSSMQDMIDAHGYMIEQLTSSMGISKFDLADNILPTDPNRGVKLGKQIGII